MLSTPARKYYEFSGGYRGIEFQEKGSSRFPSNEKLDIVIKPTHWL